MTVNQMAQILVREQAEKSGDPNFIAMVENWIASALKVIAMKSNWKFFQKNFSFATAASNPFYNLPEEARKIKFLQISNTDTTLIYRDKGKSATLRQDFEQLGTPKFWSYVNSVNVSGDNFRRIELTPIPNSIMDINGEYYYHPIDIVSSSEIPLDQSFDEAIMCFVRSKMMKVDKNYIGANLEMKDFDTNLASAIVAERQQSAENVVNEPTDIPAARMFNHRLRYTWE
jgi:hypothetical protein